MKHVPRRKLLNSTKFAHIRPWGYILQGKRNGGRKAIWEKRGKIARPISFAASGSLLQDLEILVTNNPSTTLSAPPSAGSNYTGDTATMHTLNGDSTVSTTRAEYASHPIRFPAAQSILLLRTLTSQRACMHSRTDQSFHPGTRRAYHAGRRNPHKNDHHHGTCPHEYMKEISPGAAASRIPGGIMVLHCAFCNEGALSLVGMGLSKHWHHLCTVSP